MGYASSLGQLCHPWVGSLALPHVHGSSHSVPPALFPAWATAVFLDPLQAHRLQNYLVAVKRQQNLWLSYRTRQQTIMQQGDGRVAPAAACSTCHSGAAVPCEG